MKQKLLSTIPIIGFGIATFYSVLSLILAMSDNIGTTYYVAILLIVILLGFVTYRLRFYEKWVYRLAMILTVISALNLLVRGPDQIDIAIVGSGVVLFFNRKAFQK